MPVCSADDTDTIVTVQGLRVRVLDEDYMTVTGNLGMRCGDDSGS